MTATTGGVGIIVNIAKWRYCPPCDHWARVVDDRCPTCSGPMQQGKVSREKPEQRPITKAPPADPRVVKPAGNREVKPW